MASPRHPYTRALLDADSGHAEPQSRLRAIPGQPPPLTDLPPGCPFAPRCPLAEERCTQAIPPRRAVRRGQGALHQGRRGGGGMTELNGATGRPRAGRATATATGQDRVLETRGITKTYHAPHGGLVHALADVDVLVRRGRTLGVVGESGSGKTTLTRQLLKLETPTSGEVVFEGRPLADAGRRTTCASTATPSPPCSRTRTARSTRGCGSGRRSPSSRRSSAPARRSNAGPAPRSCSSWSASAPGWPSATRTSCRAVSASASPSPAPSPRTPRWSSSTSRCRRSTCRSAPRSSTCCSICRTGSASRTCSSATTSGSSATCATTSS